MLGISVELVQDVIRHAKAFDATVPVVGDDDLDGAGDDPGSDLTDDEAREALQDHVDDPAYVELKNFIDSLNEEEQVNLVAIAWIGRGTFAPDEWEDALEEATDEHSDHTAEYLLGTPLLGTYLEEGLSALGYPEDED